MSGMSRNEIAQLLARHDKRLASIYPGCSPEDVCRVRQEIESRSKVGTTGSDSRLRGLTRILARWMEEGASDHRVLVAAASSLTGNLDINASFKQAKKLVQQMAANPNHELNRSMPEFVDGVLLRPAA